MVLHECTDFYTCMCNAARGAHRGMSKGGAVEPFATPTSETDIRCQFSPVLRRVQGFMTFRACLVPQKCD